MNCREVVDRLVFYVDGELPLSETDRIRAHVEGCEPCSRRARAERSVREAVGGIEFHQSPPGLETRIRASLDEAVRREHRFAFGLLDRVLSRQVLGTVAAALIVAVGWLAFLQVSGTTAIAGEEVSLHGTLVCADCSASGLPIDRQKHCKAYGHSTGLLTENGEVLNFVKKAAAPREVLDLLFSPPRRGTRVGVEGRLFRDIGYIEIDRVSEL